MASAYTFKQSKRSADLVDVFRVSDGERVGTLRRHVVAKGQHWSGTDRCGIGYPGPYRNREQAARAMDPKREAK